MRGLRANSSLSQSDNLTSNLKKFKSRAVTSLQEESPELSGSEDDLANGWRWRPKKMSLEQKQRHELETAELEHLESISALLELRDMEDELVSLLRLFDTQNTIVCSMLEIYQGDTLKDVTHNGRVYLEEALSRLDEYKRQVRETITRVNDTRMDVSLSTPFLLSRSLVILRMSGVVD